MPRSVTRRATARKAGLYQQTRPAVKHGPRLCRLKRFGLTRMATGVYIRPKNWNCRKRESVMLEPDAHLEVSQEGDVSVVRFADRKILEEVPIAEIGDRLNSLADSEPHIKLLLDFGNVEHLSSAVLSMLINLNKRIDESGGKLKLANIKPQIYEVFKITRLDTVFDIYDTTAKAKASY
jgi:anti-sigma B factor antagonist